MRSRRQGICSALEFGGKTDYRVEIDSAPQRKNASSRPGLPVRTGTFKSMYRPKEFLMSGKRSRPSGQSPQSSKPKHLPAAQSVEAPVSTQVRLQKVLADAGVASRRHSEEIILEGRVSVDGQVVTELGFKVNPAQQRVLVDDRPIFPERKVYYMVNKPEGFLSTNDDPEGRQRVIDLLPKMRERLYPVGRLDESSQGLMLVTNDGPLANRLLHPRYQVPKVYRVQVAGHPDRAKLEALRSGQEFAEGVFQVESFSILKSLGDSTFVEIVLNEGHNREIRRLFARIEHKVMKLQRIAFGPLRLAKLGVGDFRHLTTYEIKQLKELAAEGEARQQSKKSRGGRYITGRRRTRKVQPDASTSGETTSSTAPETVTPRIARPGASKSAAKSPASSARRKNSLSHSDRPASGEKAPAARKKPRQEDRKR